MDFILNDETVINSHGFMLLGAGARLERFTANPVMLYGHKDDFVLGAWDNLSIKDKQITATPKFDSKDPDAAKIEGKVERGFIKGASMGITIHNAELKQVGSDYVPVVTDWTLLEASIVSIPSNQAALSLMVYNEKGEPLSPDQVKLNLSALTNTAQTLNNKTMDKILLTADAYAKLGIDSNANDVALSAAVVKLAARAELAEKELNDSRTTAATTLVDTAIAEGRLTAEKKESFTKLAVTDYKQAAEIIAALPAKQNLAAGVETTAPASGDDLLGIPTDRKGWSYLKFMKEDPKGFEKLRKEHPDTVAKLKAAYGK